MKKSQSPKPLASRSLKDVRRIVVKIGSALLVDSKTGLRQPWLQSLVDDVAMFRARGQEVAIISSGAVALGRRYLGLSEGTLRLEESQAAAAAGQSLLMRAYQEAFDRQGIGMGQILLTMRDTEYRRGYLNARETIETLFSLKAVPVVNENDSVTTQEIRFGDNDRLSARLAQMIGADILVLFSDVDGLYSADPSLDSQASLIGEVRKITPDIETMAGPSRSDNGSGGMVTKLMAAKIALASGCRVVIAQGYADHALALIDENSASAGTWFFPRIAPKNAHLRWIASTLKPAGIVVIDGGAVAALRQGGSLLPPGVIKVEGQFERGDIVNVLAQNNQILGRGLIAYDSQDARKIAGHKTDEIEAILGYRGRPAMIHHDHLALD